MFGDVPRRTTPLRRTALIAATVSLVALGAPCLATAQTGTAQPAAGAIATSSASTGTAGAPKIEYNPTAYAAAAKSPSWVQTPEGLAYKTCVHVLPAGAHVDDGSIVLANGTRTMPATCPYPRLVDKPAEAHGPQAGALGNTVPASASGWFQASWWNSSVLRGITSDYSVPSAPSVNGAINFFFSSLEDSDGSDILQPVLGYGTNNLSGVTGTGNFWYIESWYVWANNNNWYVGSTVRVNTGDTIAGSVLGNDCNSDGTGCFFTVSAKDVQSGQASTIGVTSDQSFTNAQGGVFESHNSSGCNYLPANGNVDFTNIKVFGNTGAQVTPSWFTFINDQECSMVLDHSNTETYIHWTP